jgi:hypothetical protein
MNNGMGENKDYEILMLAAMVRGAGVRYEWNIYHFY